MRLAILFYRLGVLALTLTVVGVFAGWPFLGVQGTLGVVGLAIVGTLFLVSHLKGRVPRD